MLKYVYVIIARVFESKIPVVVPIKSIFMVLYQFWYHKTCSIKLFEKATVIGYCYSAAVGVIETVGCSCVAGLLYESNRCLKCAKKTPPTPLHHQPAQWEQGMMIHVLILFTPNFDSNRNRDSSDQATFFQSSTVQFW